MNKTIDSEFDLLHRSITDKVTLEMISYAERRKTRYDFFTTADRQACTCCRYMETERSDVNPCGQCLWNDIYV